MKKTILFTIPFLFTFFISTAQITKGSLLLGGGVNVNTNKIESMSTERKGNYLFITPVVGIAVRKNTIVGIQLLYGHQKDNINYAPAELKSDFYGGGVFLRKYLTIGKGFYLFGESDLYYRNDTYVYTSGTLKNKQKGWNIGINFYPGISYSITKKFHLEAGLAQLARFEYGKTKTTGTTTEERSGFTFNANASSLSNFNIGFRVFISK